MSRVTDEKFYTSWVTSLATPPEGPAEQPLIRTHAPG